MLFQTDFSPDPEAPVLVIGAAGVDIVGGVKGELHLGTSTPARIRSAYGGVARNVAENLARLGHPVTLVAALGEDQAGDQLLARISAAGVDTSAVLRTADSPTGSYLAVINARSELQFALDDMRVISSLTPDYLEEHYSLFKQASLLFLDANLSKETLRKAFSLARKAKLPVCADPTSNSLARRLRPYLSRLFLITPNSVEAGILCDAEVDAAKLIQARDAAKCLVGRGVGLAVITLAQFGVCYATTQTSGHIPAIRTEIVDPTGAGDALTAALLFGLLNEIPLDDAMRLGVSAASLALRHVGAVPPDLSLELLYDQLVI